MFSKAYSSWLLTVSLGLCFGLCASSQAGGTQETKAVPTGPSDAERIIQVQRAIDADKKELDQIKARLNDPLNEFDAAENDFNATDIQLAEMKRRLQKLQETGQQADAERLAQELKLMQEDWDAAKKRFELALVEQRTLKDKLAALTRKIEHGQATLKKLREASTHVAATWFFGKDKTAAPQPSTTAVKTTTDPVSWFLPLPSANASAKPAETTDNQPEKKEVAEAREAVRFKESLAKEAKEKAKSVQERIADMRRDLELEQRLHSVARQKAETSQTEHAKLEKEFQQKLQTNAPEQELKSLWTKVTAARQRRDQAMTDSLASADRIKGLQTELNQVQTELIAAQQEAEQKDREARNAQQFLTDIQNPYTWRNLQQWLLDHGPRMLLILVGMWLLNRMVRLTGGRVVRLVSRHHKRGSLAETEGRAQTLHGVLNNTTGVLVIIGGGLMLLVEAGLPVVPLLGGAGIFGLAIAFGAQNLIKDYFCGFMILLEDQYGISDYVQIGSIEGTVEQITLRVTALRDQKGTLHFIPHGGIQTVSNFTHTWSRAKVLVAVSYKEDIDQVLDLLRGLVREVRNDPIFSSLILDDPESMGVADLTDTAVTIQFYLKTKPMQQWNVRREILRRIKSRFEQENISIPLQARIFHPPIVEEMLQRRAHAA
jgi:moderate conductance mechanosensitive channel